MSHSLSPKCNSFPPPGNRLSEANVCVMGTLCTAVMRFSLYIQVAPAEMLSLILIV